jgi:hypothetical protein
VGGRKIGLERVNTRNQVSYLHKTGRTAVTYILIFISSDSQCEDNTTFWAFPELNIVLIHAGNFDLLTWLQNMWSVVTHSKGIHVAGT